MIVNPDDENAEHGYEDVTGQIELRNDPRKKKKKPKYKDEKRGNNPNQIRQSPKANDGIPQSGENKSAPPESKRDQVKPQQNNVVRQGPPKNTTDNVNSVGPNQETSNRPEGTNKKKKKIFRKNPNNKGKGE